MKKCFKFVFCIGLALVTGYNVYRANAPVELSALELANVEALCSTENGSPCGGPKSEMTGNCMSTNTVNCKDLSGCQ